MLTRRQNGAVAQLDFDLLRRNGRPRSRKTAVERGALDDTYRAPISKIKRLARYDASADAVLYHGSCMELMRTMPDGSIQLAVTSPPYNIGKEYETRSSLEDYIEAQRETIVEVNRLVAEGGSICWQVGNHVYKGEVFPLDSELYPIFKSLGLHMRNRIVWHYEHGLHASRRFSGRYEVIVWYTKGSEPHFFDPDPVRIPQKYPQKRHFRGPRVGQLSSNPLGKNPGDVWLIPNVKWNHVEKTSHPCQFPVELVERLVLSMTRPGDRVFDPYGGVGSTVLAAVLNGRKGIMAETVAQYVEIASGRLDAAEGGELRTRPMSRRVYQPS